MKKENEKKSIVKSIKLSQKQYEYIQEQANNKGMNFSEYMIDSAMHRENHLSPQILVKVQEIANIADTLADRLDYEEYQAKEQLKIKSADLSELFHVDYQLQNHDSIKEEIDKIMKGAEELWACLK